MHINFTPTLVKDINHKEGMVKTGDRLQLEVKMSGGFVKCFKDGTDVVNVSGSCGYQIYNNYNINRTDTSGHIFNDCKYEDTGTFIAKLDCSRTVSVLPLQCDCGQHC